MEIRIKKLWDDAFIPEKEHPGDSAYDVRVPEDTMVKVGRSVIKLDLAVEVPLGYEAHIQPRSGMSLKGMLASNGIRYDCDVIEGKIDSNYRGNIGVIVNNRSGVPFTLGRGAGIAQMTIRKVEDVVFVEVDSLSDTDRGENGFGS